MNNGCISQHFFHLKQHISYPHLAVMSIKQPNHRLTPNSLRIFSPFYLLKQGQEPAARVNIWFGRHRNFRYPSYCRSAEHGIKAEFHDKQTLKEQVKKSLSRSLTHFLFLFCLWK